MKPFRTVTRHFPTALAAFVLIACSAEQAETSDEAPAAAANNGVVNLYSSRHYDADLDIYEAFTRETGIEVNLIEADADALIARIESEGEFSPADVLLTVDAGRLWRAEQADILSPVDSAVLEERIPAEFQHPDDLWFGFATRARVIIYNRAAGPIEPLASYADLADPAHRGRICMRSSSNIYNVSLLASIISHEGPEQAEQWARGVHANFARPPQGNDTGNIEAVAAGDCTISIVNSYYIARFIASDDPEQQAVAEKIGVIFPNQADRGAHVNISGAGVPKHAPNPENAIAFLEFMTGPTAQDILSRGNHEYPVIDGAAADTAIQQLGSFERDTLDVSELGRFQTEAVRIFDRVGWN